MQISITVEELLESTFSGHLVDVRKPEARAASGFGMPGVQWRHPFDAINWVDSLPRHRVVVFCVHGHEVSQAVAGYLRDEGVDALYLEGGFEAWKEAGGQVDTLDVENEG